MGGSAVGSGGGFLEYPSTAPGDAETDAGAPTVWRSRYPIEL